MSRPGPIRYLDLFAGCGGLTEGFERTGLFKPVAFVEWDADAALTLSNRLKERWGLDDAADRVLTDDIRDMERLLTSAQTVGNRRSSLRELVDRAGGIDLVIGGPPCQAYSIAGRVRDTHGMRHDYRNYLFEAYVELVRAFNPLAFVFENVPGMLSARPGDVLITDRIREAFADAGYHLTENLRDAALFDLTQYGLPQRRKRVIVIGVRKTASSDAPGVVAQCYRALAGAGVGPQTVFDAIGDLPGLFPLASPEKRNGRRHSHSEAELSVPDHEPRFHNARDIGIFRELAEDLRSGDGLLNSVDKIKKLYESRVGRSAAVHKYYVLRWGEQSNTIPAHLFKDGLRHIHPDPDQARSLTVREAARLQGFPDDFRFLGSQTSRYKMIGNAVPPPFAETIARSVALSVFLTAKTDAA